MAGPIDARVNPGRMDRMAARQSPALLERTVIASVPWPYGVFSGSRFEQEIYPKIRAFIADNDGRAT
jgi:poly-beta-hydroxyalkanoate depolymerase